MYQNLAATQLCRKRKRLDYKDRQIYFLFDDIYLVSFLDVNIDAACRIRDNMRVPQKMCATAHNESTASVPFAIIT